MIWQYPIEPKNEPLCQSQAWTKHILEQLSTAGIVANDVNDADQYADIAAAVSEYLQRNARDGTVSETYLLMLITRALWALGKTDSARKLWRINGRALNLPAPGADAALNPHITLPVWATFLDARAVRSATFHFCGKQPLWILDVHKLLPDKADIVLEMTMSRALHSALEWLSEVWDTTAGHGNLGIYRLRQAAARVTGTALNSDKTRCLYAELRSDCAHSLRAISIQRGWRAHPAIFNL